MPSLEEARANILHNWLVKAGDTLVRLRQESVRVADPRKRSELDGRVRQLETEVMAQGEQWVELRVKTSEEQNSRVIRPGYFRQLAQTFVNTGNYGLAVKAYDEALNRASSKPDKTIQLERVEALATSGNWAAAREDYRRLIEGYWPGGREEGLLLKVRLGYATTLFHLGQFDDAEEFFLQAVEQAENRGDGGRQITALNYLASIAREQAKDGIALAYYNRALALAPDNASTETQAILLVNRAHLHAEFGDYAAAVQDYTDALEFTPTNAAAYNGRGIAQTHLKRTGQVLTDFAESVRFAPEIAEYKVNYGISLYKEQQYDGAKAQFLAAKRLGYKDSEALEGLGICAIAVGNFSLAMRYFREAVKANEKSANAWGHIGGLLVRRGKYREALAAYSSAQQTGKPEQVVEKAWAITLQGLTEGKLSNSALVEYGKSVGLVAKENLHYHPAEWAAAVALVTPDRKLVRQNLERLLENNDLLTLFYLQNAAKALVALAAQT